MILLSILFILTDQISKYLFYNMWYYVDSIFLFQPILNDGISWSIAADLLVVICVTILFIILLIQFYRTRYIDKRSFVLLLSGALGNLIDRIIYNWVRDWIRLWWWPVFNLADVWISIGLIVYIYKHFIKKD